MTAFTKIPSGNKAAHSEKARPACFGVDHSREAIMPHLRVARQVVSHRYNPQTSLPSNLGSKAISQLAKNESPSTCKILLLHRFMPAETLRSSHPQSMPNCSHRWLKPGREQNFAGTALGFRFAMEMREHDFMCEKRRPFKCSSPVIIRTA